MSGDHQMHTHFVNTGYPYASPENFTEYYGGVTHMPVNYVYPGSMHNQENMYWSMNVNPYRYGFSDPASASYYGYEVNHHPLPRSDVNQRNWEYTPTESVEEPASANVRYEENAASSSEDSAEECFVSEDAANSEEPEVLPDNIDPDNMTYEELLDLGEAVGTQSRGLSHDLIKTLPTSWYKASRFFSRKKPKERCVICLLTYKIGDQQITLPCKHVYHKKCGTKWLSINKTCPVCNLEVLGD